MGFPSVRWTTMTSEGGESGSKLLFQVQKDSGRKLPSSDLEFKCRELGLGWHQQVSKEVNRSSHSWGSENTMCFRETPLGHPFYQGLNRSWRQKKDRQKVLNHFPGLKFPKQLRYTSGEAFWSSSDVEKHLMGLPPSSSLPSALLVHRLNMSVFAKLWTLWHCCLRSLLR